MILKNFSFKIKQLPDEAGKFAGYASVYNVKDLQGDIIRKGAFLKSIKEKNPFPLCWAHDIRNPIGIVNLSEDDYGLRCEGELNLEVQEGREKRALMLQGAIKGLSIGFDVINQEKLKDGTNVITEGKLYEVSLVLFPANELAQVQVVKGWDDWVDYCLTEFDIDLTKMDAVKREWTVAFINSLPDAAFAVIEPAYKRGETEDKRARHLPHHNENVKDPDEKSSLDMPHFRNALARMNQIKPVTDSISTDELRSKAEAHLNKHKKQVEEEQKTAELMEKLDKFIEMVRKL